MGKPAKKKDSRLKGAQQRRHNRTTRGINTNRCGPLWSKRQHNEKDKDGNTITKTINVRVPTNTGWDLDKLDKKSKEFGLPEPFDALHLDWAEEMKEYVAELNDVDGIIAKVKSNSLPNGRYVYSVIKKYVDCDEQEVLFSVECSHSLNFGPVGKFAKKR